ncbi:digestive organ expansion factor [Russula aff. rugulosa BPL654]|nr:digestive organ expansion factor [Russula aff. rugulosa BPL654]
MDVDDWNSPTTKLLTLLNVSAAKSSKRKFSDRQSSPTPTQKLNKRRVEILVPGNDDMETTEPEVGEPEQGDSTGEVGAGEAADVSDAEGDDEKEPTHEQHFETAPSLLNQSAIESVNKRVWSVSIHLRLLQDELLSILASHRDLYHTHTSQDTAPALRDSISLHILDHVTKKRRRVLKNNERLAHAAKAGNPAPEDVQDQGFTRPSILILLPFQGVADKFSSGEPDAYPRDHAETFEGNSDDDFRVGLKLTRKSVRLFTEFYGSDIIIASPLGLRMSIEKEKNFDFLSSIEILVADELDSLTMQNWEHTQFVFSHLNQLPKESHDTDFSRIKHWYLDGHAVYLRQTVLLSSYETPEIRSLFNQSLKNLEGRVRTIRRWAPVQVPEGLDQNFIEFDCSNPKDELDKRFAHFTNQLLPPVLKSAVQSANTVIFVPSSLDFIRIRNHFRRQQLSFTVLSEYSTNQDISRARQAFFTGKKSFLIITERFHFYRRYKIRGIRNLIFYGPPDHAAFYTEFLSYPFLDDGVEPSDVTCRVLYSRYDWFKMERIAGTKGASQLIKGSGL